jgi:hypothetical protein
MDLNGTIILRVWCWQCGELLFKREYDGRFDFVKRDGTVITHCPECRRELLSDSYTSYTPREIAGIHYHYAMDDVRRGLLTLGEEFDTEHALSARKETT